MFFICWLSSVNLSPRWRFKVVKAFIEAVALVVESFPECVSESVMRLLS